MKKIMFLSYTERDQIARALVLDHFRMNLNDKEYTERYLLYLEHKYCNKNTILNDKSVLISQEDLLIEIENQLKEYFNIFNAKKIVYNASLGVIGGYGKPISKTTMTKIPYNLSDEMRKSLSRKPIFCVQRDKRVDYTVLSKTPSKEELFKEFENPSILKVNTNRVIGEILESRKTNNENELREMIPNLF